MIEGREKPLWIDAAFTVIIGDWQGKETLQLIDERTGEKYPCFELKREDGPGDSYQPTTSGPAPAVDQDDVPF